MQDAPAPRTVDLWPAEGLEIWARRLGSRVANNEVASMYNVRPQHVVQGVYYFDHKRAFEEGILDRAILPKRVQNGWFIAPGLAMPSAVFEWCEERFLRGVPVFDVPNLKLGVVQLLCVHHPEEPYAVVALDPAHGGGRYDPTSFPDAVRFDTVLPPGFSVSPQ